MTQRRIARPRIWLLLAALVLGFGVGGVVPGLSQLMEIAIWPTLGLLLYTTFLDVPFRRIADSLRDGRFLCAVLAGNFVAVPLLVWGLLVFAPAEPAIRLGVLMVLLVPCTDWFISFTHLAGGDASRAMAVTPVNLVVQFAALPIYLWLLLGETFGAILAAERIATVFTALIVVPLFAARATAWCYERRNAGSNPRELLAHLQVPLLALVVFLVSASQVHMVRDSTSAISVVMVLFAGYLIAAAAIGIGLGRLFGLGGGSLRALIFSLGTRNSFVVLPLALALGPEFRPAIVVIVLQSLVELLGMIGYVWVVPRLVPLQPALRPSNDSALKD